jgi:thiamine biosynthesis lipoprotein
MDRREFVGAMGACVAGAWRPLPPRPGRADVSAERWSWAMGQPVHLIVFAGSEAEGLDACGAALAELRRVEDRLTLFDDASDLCELNRCAGRAALRVDRDLRAVLELARRFTGTTDGAFNVAVEPLMRAWGFHRPRTHEPTAAEIGEARDTVTAAVIDLDGDRALLPSAHTQLDFGGIGVGYAIDRALAVLETRGIRRALLDVSGDIGALGTPPGESGWSVAIADPARPGGTTAVVRLRDAALATSANTESVVRYGPHVRGHVLNPVTGWPAHALRQASVVARTAVEADALSTALLVSGRRTPGALAVFPVS